MVAAAIAATTAKKLKSARIEVAAPVKDFVELDGPAAVLDPEDPEPDDPEPEPDDPEPEPDDPEPEPDDPEEVPDAEAEPEVPVAVALEVEVALKKMPPLI